MGHYIVDAPYDIQQSFHYDTFCVNIMGYNELHANM
jgi:hypothetical protein